MCRGLVVLHLAHLILGALDIALQAEMALLNSWVSMSQLGLLHHAFRVRAVALWLPGLVGGGLVRFMQCATAGAVLITGEVIVVSVRRERKGKKAATASCRSVSHGL